MTTTPTIREKMLTIERELNDQYIARDKEIRGLNLALLSKAHILILGNPGTAKTSMCQTITARTGLSFFRRLITQFSTPDELFGPVDIKAYKEDGMFRRLVQGKAPTSEVVYLDEVFKGGPTILNSLLSLMEERLYDNDGVTLDCPLVTLIGTSNELPGDDAGLEAFYDRFLLRFIVTYLDDAGDFRSMLQSKVRQGGTEITSDELAEAQAEVEALGISGITYESMDSIWEALREESIAVSDRRFKQMLTVMKADAWLRGMAQVMPDNVIVGANILWTKPDQQRVVERIVRTCVNPHRARAVELWESAKEAFDDALQDSSRVAAEWVQDATQLKNMTETMKELLKDLSGDAEVAKMLADMTKWEAQLIAKVLAGGG